MNVAKIISDNTCVHCGNVVNENLRKWFKDKWVNIGKKKKGGGHPPCGTSGKKRGYAKCVPKSKAANMTKKQKASATRRKRAAQNKAGRGGTDSTRGGGKKPINVKTKAESKMNLESYVGKMMTEAQFDEAAGEKDACYHKVKARYDVWPSAYASGALVKCRKVGAKNWGNKSKKEGVNERTRMKPQVKKLLKQKGYGPIFGAIDSSKQQLKQMRYSRGEIRDTLISMFGDEDPKILQRIKESINEKKGDFLDSLFPKSKVAKAVKIAHEMGGDMTGAVKKIERYFKGMTLHSKVRDALQQANESINESEQDKIKQFLMKKGDNEKDATEKLKYYDMVSKMYKGANSTKKAEIMSSLWANEAVNNPSFFDSFSITEVRKMSDRELKDYLLYMKKYKPDVWNHMKKNKDLKKMIRKLRVESVNEGVSKSQAQEIMNQLGGRKFEMLMGVKSKGIGKDGLILHIGKNPKRVSHIIIDLDRGRDLYNLTFGKIVKYQFKVIKKLKGIYVDQLHDMIEKYTGNLTTFRPRR